MFVAALDYPGAAGVSRNCSIVLDVHSTIMDPPSFLHFGHLAASVAGAVYCQRGVLSTPLQRNPRASFDDVEATYGQHFARAKRMPAPAFHELTNVLQPSLPRRGIPPVVRTAIALR